ncbi:thioredoxin-like protein [Pandoraea sputorum]|uniref:Thioredoxin-like protein n=1 Tax=Pandoraea sputorum TaxID=93222 RepID=A0A5E5AT28_9BURK|nr:thioredoxin-like protein [Pandoraea sputorum]
MGRARLLKSLIASTVITLPIIAPVAAFASPGTQSADGSLNQSVGHPTSTASTLVLAQATGVTYPHEGAAAKPLDNKTAAKQQAAVPLATDFAAHARRAASLDAPLIVLVSLRDCVYCGPIRQRELAPLVRSGKYEVREIGMDSTTPVRDFDGATTTGVAWARAHGVKVSPTVLFLDTSGRPIADPLIGAGLPDFYGAYLDDAIARGRARLHPGSGTTTR